MLFQIVSVSPSFINSNNLRNWFILKHFLQISHNVVTARHINFSQYVLAEFIRQNPLACAKWWLSCYVAYIVIGPPVTCYITAQTEATFSGVMPVQGHPKWESSTDVQPSLKCLNQLQVWDWPETFPLIFWKQNFMDTLRNLASWILQCM